MLKFLLYFNLLASFLGMGQAISFGKLGGGINNNGYYTPVRGMFYDTIDKVIYVSGQFAQADNKTVWGVARWHNNMWDSLRGGFAQFPQQTPSINSGSQSWAWTITRFQNKIYFAGGISYVSGQLTCCMAVWNGTGWDPPMAQLPNGLIRQLLVYNNTLYACGDFTKFGTTTCNYIAKFDGFSWQPVGDFSNYLKTSTPPAQVNSLEVYNNELYVGGGFSDTTNVPKNIAKFNGTKWVNVGTGIQQGGFNFVSCMQSFNTKLYIGGRFGKTAQIPGEGLVYWDGLNYHGVNSESIINGGQVNYMNKYKDEKLFVIGGFNNYSTPSIINMFYVGTNNVPCGISGMDSTYAQLSPTFYNIERCSFIGDSLIVAGLFKKLDTVSANSIGFIRNFDNNPNCLPVGIKTNHFENDLIKVYPNPFKDKLNVEFSTNEIKDIKFKIINNLVQEVYSSNNPTQKQEIDLSFLASGIYYLKIQSASEQKVVKIIKE
jgi:hypothetical protein